ncbi:MAG: NfeD family protein [Planctomycetia bacterium]|nr:NfeD family protein [Planctomycetia bacterium]
MTYVYGTCAIIGGTVMVCQFLLTLFGLGHDVHDGGGDVGHDFAGDHAGGDAGHDASHDDHHTDSTWLFGVITFRTVVAALAFFGLAGLAADSAAASPPVTIGIAVVAGLAAMYGVHWMMQFLRKMREEGTVRIHSAVGCTGTVYLRVPGQKSGAGKVTVDVRGREVEYEAMTAGGELATGARVIVVDVLGPDTVEVAQESQVEASA